MKVGGGGRDLDGVDEVLPIDVVLKDEKMSERDALDDLTGLDGASRAQLLPHGLHGHRFLEVLEEPMRLELIQIRALGPLLFVQLGALVHKLPQLLGLLAQIAPK